ncbi:hypothetical protein I6E43_15975, partial [Fusobacterium varium]|nr:hypothetical protein [Fusobacterium varium]
YSGLSKGWIPKGLKILEELKVIELVEERSKGKFKGKKLIFTPENIEEMEKFTREEEIDNEEAIAEETITGKTITGKTITGETITEETTTGKTITGETVAGFLQTSEDIFVLED